MYDELIERLRECTAEMNGEKTLWHQAADVIEELQKDLERSKDFEAFWQHEAEEALKKFQVAISNKPHWIPVTERLPDKKQKCLVLIKLRAIPPLLSPDILTYNPDDFTWNGYDSEWGDFARRDIQYWMPLPQPPKDGES